MFKRVLDLVVSVTFLVLTLPFLTVFILLWTLYVKGSPLFVQERVGVDLEPFKIYKFKTMRPNDGRGNGNKSNGDDRIFPLAGFLRKHSVDEIPQIFNVLIGNMSLVGPRPITDAEVALLAPDALARFKVKPGMTGLWQVSGRSDVSWTERHALDIHYVNNHNVFFDIKIMLMTFRAVVFGHGAY